MWKSFMMLNSAMFVYNHVYCIQVHKVLWICVIGYFTSGELETANKRPRDADKALQQNTFEEHNPVKPTEDQLADLSKEIVAYWKHLARKLKLPNCEVQRIQKDHINYDDITEKANAMLLTWLELDTNAYVTTLRDALISLGKKDTAVRHFPM